MCCGGEGAVLAEGFAQTGDGRIDVELIGVGGVHAGDDGCDEVIEHFLAHADAHELTEGLRVFACGDGQELIHLGAAQTVLTDDGDQRLIVHVAGDAHDAGAGGATGALRQVQPGAVGVGGDDLVAQAEFLDEVADNGAAGCEGFCAGVQQKAANFMGTNRTAKVVALFEQGDAHTGCGEAACGDQAGGAAADDDGGGCLLVVGESSCVLGRGGGAGLCGPVRCLVGVAHGGSPLVCVQWSCPLR